MCADRADLAVRCAELCVEVRRWARALDESTAMLNAENARKR